MLALVALAGAIIPTAAASTLREDTVEIPAGSYYREDLFLPADGSDWQISAQRASGAGTYDVYIIRTIDLLGSYPRGGFSPLEAREEVVAVSFNFDPANRAEAYSLIIDNLDNSRPFDASPEGALAVHILRSPPLRGNPEAAAALSSASGVCAAVLAFSAVGLAVYLKKRPRRPSEEALLACAPRIEVEVDVPARPRGAWADPEEDEPDRAGEGPPEGGPKR